jgi:two-component system sensor histidine kinase/response regulator
MQPDPVTIVVIDDKEAITMAIKAVLEQAGYRVWTAANGTDGLRLVRELRPDVVLCDVVMPPPDGFSVRGALSRDPDTAHIPFVFLTARTALRDKLRGLGLGADDYITKPFHKQELLARIGVILRRAELDRQRRRAEAEAQMERLRGEILKNVTHELRTPVVELMANLDLLLREKFGEDFREQQTFVQAALNSARRLSSVVDDLVTLIQMGRGEKQIFRQRIDLETGFRQPIEECLKLWQNRRPQGHLVIEPGVVLYAPRKRFRQAVVHLIDNACKFGPEGGRVEAELVPQGEGGGILTVADQGPGIPADLREKVFEPYFQASQGEARLYPGLGVGLTIARGFARALGGDLVVLDSDVGCRMRMTIPPGPVDWDAPQRAPVDARA